MGETLTRQTAYPLIDMSIKKNSIKDIKDFIDLPDMGWIQTNAWELASNGFYLLLLIIATVLASLKQRGQNHQAEFENYQLEDIRIE